VILVDGKVTERIDDDIPDSQHADTPPCDKVQNTNLCAASRLAAETPFAGVPITTDPLFSNLPT